MGLLRLRVACVEIKFRTLVDFHVQANKDGHYPAGTRRTTASRYVHELDGVPFHPDNSCTNDNFVCHIFGNVGFPHFDKKRLRMGLPCGDVFGHVFTCGGALSLSTDKDIVFNIAWPSRLPIVLKNEMPSGVGVHRL